MLEKDLAGISLSHRSALLVTWDIFVFVFVFVFVLVDILRYLCLTGQLPIPLKSLCSFNKMLSDGQNINVLSETWILPFAVLFAMVAYAVLAIVFFNQDDWFHFDWVYRSNIKVTISTKDKITGIWCTLNVTNVVTVQCYQTLIQCYPLLIQCYQLLFNVINVWCCSWCSLMLHYPQLNFQEYCNRMTK